jgi:uncharacterized damage-inducible protein DinB
MVSVDALQQHIAYSTWATRRLLAAASELSSEELDRDFGTADKSVLGTLVHVFRADRMWLSRMRGKVIQFASPGDHALDVLETQWPAVQDGWAEWALLGEDPARVIRYQDLKGNAWETPAWQIVLHVVNHASHHRGQVSGFLRTMGHKPPALDEILYYRGL